jgi:PAS domain S-box-containing protein
MDDAVANDSGNNSQVDLSSSIKQASLELFPAAGDLPAECDLLRGLVMSLHETVIMGLDRSGRYLFLWGDPELAKQYGVDYSDFSGKGLSDVFPEKDAARRIADVGQVFDCGLRFRLEYPVDFPGGTFWHDVSISPLRDESGKVIACLGIIQDITRSKRVEHSLKESEDRYRSVVDQSADFIVMHNAGKILFANRAAAAAAGVEDPDEMIGRPVLDLVHPDSREVVRRRMALAGDTPGILPPIEEKFVGREGRVFYGEAIGQRVSFNG